MVATVKPDRSQAGPIKGDLERQETTAMAKNPKNVTFD